MDLSRRFLNGKIEPEEMFPSLMKLGKAYNPYTDLRQLPHMITLGLRMNFRLKRSSLPQITFSRAGR